MPLNDLQDIIDAINAGTPQEKLAFKNLIVNGLNAQDLADIITASNNTQKIELAKMIVNADTFLQNQLNQQAIDEKNANIATAITWWTNTALPTLNNPITSRDEALQNYKDIAGAISTQTDQWRLYILRQKLRESEENFKEAKKGNLPIAVT